MNYLKCELPRKVKSVYPAVNLYCGAKNFIETHEFNTKLEIPYYLNNPLTNEWWLARFYPLPIGTTVYDRNENRWYRKITIGDASDCYWINTDYPRSKTEELIICDRKIYGFQSYLYLSCPIKPLH